MRNRRNWIEVGVAAGAFGVLLAVVMALDAPRELVPAIWMGGVLGVAGTGSGVAADLAFAGRALLKSS